MEVAGTRLLQTVMGVFIKMHNKLALERAKMLAYIKSIGMAGGRTWGAGVFAHKVVLLLVDFVFEGGGRETCVRMLGVGSSAHTCFQACTVMSTSALPHN